MRLRLFWFSIAALYVAPVLAGLYGAGWGVVAGFALIFVAFNALMERIPPGPLLAAASVAVVAALALLLTSAGWGLRALTGFDRPFPPWPWLALAAASTVLARLVWPPKLSRELDALVDDARRQVEQAGGSDD